jgi:LacI family transcriptional regulator
MFAVIDNFTSEVSMINDYLFSNLSRSAQEFYLLQEEILQGKFGSSGDVFLTTRALADRQQISIMTAHNVLKQLCEAGFLELRGKRYFLSYANIMETHIRQKNIIGLIVPSLSNEFYASLSDAVIKAFRTKGYRVIVLSNDFSSKEERKVFSLFAHFSVAGIISTVPTSPENVSLYRDCTLPCVLLAQSMDNCKLSSVQVNSFVVSQKVARHLLEEGYRNFLYLGSKNLSLDRDSRFIGYHTELKHNGYQLEPKQILRLSVDSKTDEERILQLLNKQKESVGIFCFHDLIASKLYQICSRLGKHIPKDVGIVGFDDLSFSRTLSPPLTTVRYRIASMADMAANLLIEKINNPKTPYDNYYVEPSLIIRESSCFSQHMTTEEGGNVYANV